MKRWLSKANGPLTPVYVMGKGKRLKVVHKDLCRSANPQVKSDGGANPRANQTTSYLPTRMGMGTEVSQGNMVVEDDKSQPAPVPDGSNYHTRKHRLVESWDMLQPNLRGAHYDVHCPSTRICCFCGCTEEQIILCTDCGPTAFYCWNCSAKIHKNAVLHCPQQWKVDHLDIQRCALSSSTSPHVRRMPSVVMQGCLLPEIDTCIRRGTMYVPVMHERRIYTPWHQCPTQTSNWIKLIDSYGRGHDVMVPFCACEQKAVQLMRLNFWPGSPSNPQVAIDLRLMMMSRSFLLVAQTALMAFCSALQHLNLPGQPSYQQVNLYRILGNECAAQFRRFYYDTERLSDVYDNYPDGTECPICTSVQGVLPKVVSLDGNFRLVRKKSAGISSHPGHHSERFFLPGVQELAGTMSTTDLVQECSDFRAGDVIRSKYKSAKLDVTGLFGSICIHDYPQYFIDMKTGESLQYAVTAMQQFSSAAGIRVLYDIGCKLHAHLKSRNSPMLANIDLAVPLFHGFAHDTKCQMQYHPHRKDGFRLADGENMERLWSFLDGFAYMSREMTPANRRNLIVDALIYIGNKVISNAGLFFNRRYQNASKVATESENELQSTLSDLTDLHTGGQD